MAVFNPKEAIEKAFAQVTEILFRLEQRQAEHEKKVNEIHRLLFPQGEHHEETPEQWFARYQLDLKQRAKKQS